ncbi:MAG: argininosuccinate lyase [Planctomycetota bacterium]|nr:argininosuccinate lyase [Planctomycetota bacterium]
MWGGRFTAASDPLFTALNNSLRFDHRLVSQDIDGSIAWAQALRAAGVLGEDEVTRIIEALQAIAAEAAADPAAVAGGEEEDVHSWVEARLIERVGDLGKKLHTGRSRNDQVATDLRLWARRKMTCRVKQIREAQAALVRLAEREKTTALPGYTHLQSAQPVLFSHWALAHFEALDRDAGRFLDALKRANECPLGSGALAGTAYPIDRDRLAKWLGFDGPTRNSLDAVSDRDFVVEALAAAALCATHLSRLAEDLIVYSTAEFAYVRMGDEVTSGSSLMPQKKNPDAMELLRGKSGRILGALVSMLTTLKGLPASYNKDLQEDKEPFFDAMEQLALCLRVLVPAMDGLTVDRERTAAAALQGYANATELADYLVGKGLAFRDAHDVVGAVVRDAIERKVALEDLPLEAMQAHSGLIEEDVFDWLSLESALGRRDVIGGTAPGRVAAAIEEAKQRLAAAAEGSA